ncbi:TPA: pyocin knob domain-containing S74 family peptidase [Escherichia coli]
MATIVDAATGLQFEIVTVTAVVGNVLTVQREQEGTTARAWAAGDMLSIRTTAATLTGTVRNFGEIPSGINLNALTGSWFGQYHQSANAGASAPLNYPVAQAGVLEVLQTGVATESCIQRYTTYSNNTLHQRRYTAASSAWSNWVQIYTDKDVIPVENGGTGQTTIQGMKSAFGFGAVADQNVVPTSMGGTGSADNAQAWLNIRPQGSTPLAGDPVNDYDAATKRWVENLVNTGTVGPSMNGVMNYGVGDFHLRDSRAYKQPYEVFSDGQLLNRADWPELWAYAQMLSPIADADWLADPAKRGKYSLGNGTTTFRVPDRNGVQTGSIQALFGRGDGGNSSANGVVSESGAPNITYTAPHTMVTLASAPSQVATNGAFQSITSGDSPAAAGSGSRFIQTNFDASRCSPVYGRSAAEIVPRNFVGVWVIRASGGFVAANTSWSVINADSSAPVAGTLVVGGKVESKYSNPSSSQFARLYSSSSWGSSSYAVVEAEGSSKHAYKFYEDGTVDFRQSGKTNPFRMYTPLGTWNGITDAGVSNLTTNGMDRVAIASGSDTLVRGYSIGATKPNGYPTKVGYHMYLPGNAAFGIACVVIGGDNGKFCRYFFDIDGQIYGSTDYGNFSYTKNGTSDSRVKHGIAPVGVDKSYSNIKGLEFVEFIYDNDEQNRVRHGIIAQQAEVVEPLYVKTRKYVGSNPGEIVEQKELDTTPMLLDTMHVVQELMKKVESLEAEIAALKAAK